MSPLGYLLASSGERTRSRLVLLLLLIYICTASNIRVRVLLASMRKFRGAYVIHVWNVNLARVLRKPFFLLRWLSILLFRLLRSLD